MPNTSPYITDMVQQKAAMLMLTSSTYERYYSVVQEMSEKSGLHEAIKDGSLKISDVEARSKELWAALRDATQRDLLEVELALLLTVLARVATPSGNKLLESIALSDTASTSWLRELALRLLSNQSEWVGNAVRATRHSVRRRTKCATSGVNTPYSSPDATATVAVGPAANDYSYLMAA